MSITINDPTLLAQFKATTGVVEIRDPAGNVIGQFETTGDGKLPPGVKSPFSDEELAQFRKERTGRPLAEILRDLRERK